MQNVTLSVSNISCGHCVMAIQKALNKTDGVSKVEGDPSTKEIQVQFDAPATLDKIKSTLKDINYPAAE